MASVSDAAVHERSVRVSTAEVAALLQDLLGQKLTAVIARQKDAKAVGSWARGIHAPNPLAERRLRAAYQIANLLLQRDAPDTVARWFVGMNPHLDDRTPVMVLAEDRGSEVMQAARAFVAGAGS